MSAPYGFIDQSALGRKDDYLFRISLKALIVNENGETLVVKESGRTWWDLPGGGMDHGETFKEAIARELAEEVNLTGRFTYEIINVEDPALLEHSNLLQVRLIFAVKPINMVFSEGVDSDEVAFKNPKEFELSENDVEQRIYRYFEQVSGNET